jgi:protein O-mannosyl-transferase
MTRVKQQIYLNASAVASPFYVRWFYILMAACITLCYAQSIRFEFLPTDDTWLIALRLDELRDIRNLPSLFTEATYTVFYRPVLHLSYMIDAQFPMEAARVMHISNIIYHILACYALFHFLKLIELKSEVAVILAFLFALHPMNVQAVAWISGRNDSLLALFVLLAFNMLLSYLRSKDPGRLLLHFLFFGIALLTKETAIVLPLLFSLLVLLFFADRKKTILFLFPVWILFCAGRFALQLQFVTNLEPASASLSETIVEFLNGCLMQIGKTLLPVQQSAYPISDFTALFPYFIVIAGLIFTIVKFRFRNTKIALFGLAWFIVMLLMPTWFGASISPAVHYEHRVYSALPGLLLMISQLSVDWKKLHLRAVIPVLLFGLLLLTWRREPVYKNYSSYVTNCIKDAPNVAMFHDFAGLGLQENKRDDLAVKCFNAALEIDSTHAEYFNHRGVSLLGLKQYRAAISDFTRAEELRPLQKETSYNLSLAYYYVKEYDVALNYLKEADSLGAFVAVDYANALNRALRQNE